MAGSHEPSQPEFPTWRQRYDHTGITGATLLFVPGYIDPDFVITDINMSHTGGSAGDGCTISLGASGSGPVIFQAAVGAGAFDCFQYHGQIPVHYTEQVWAIAFGGTWDVVVSGFYVPHWIRTL